MGKKIAIGIGIIFCIVGGVILYVQWNRVREVIVSPISEEIKPIPTPSISIMPLDRYTVINLGKRTASPSAMIKDEILLQELTHTSYRFSFISENKKVTGMLNIPNGTGPFPVIVMFRGYVDREQYKTGIGTERAAGFFAKKGFITVAPDFLGYGESDMPSENVIEERFQTYIVAIDMLGSISTIEEADATKVGIWVHSNGGQIALTVLEALEQPYPTILWAPVSKPFPYSILYYTDEATDRGKLIRRALAEFEKDYDVDLYAITDYFDRIRAPIQLHQGSADDAVPQKWSDELAEALKKNEVDVEYFVYPNADHNLMPSWNIVVARDIQFYKKYLR